MQANSMCLACLFNKQEATIRPFKDEEKKKEYLREVLKLLYDHGQSGSAPWLSMKIDEIYARYFKPQIDYTAIKHKYNQYMLSKEQIVEQNIRASDDLIASCIKYVCAGNFIDFGVGMKVDDSILKDLLEKAQTETVSETELAQFKEDLANARELAYLTDNCGEIVMDKLFIKILREMYPNLHITVVLRGKPVINDATMEDAEEIGLTGLVDCIGNGVAIPGTHIGEISEEARNIILNADVVIAKGQGNFEGLYGEKINPYFLFLCKCELFVKRFGMKQFSSVFAREDEIHITE
ncbi:MAG: ARMT1-like domain-containing protein [Lachnospiraceae bacterium]|nr:ARMT1-like domain-containing protein [Lachnospiraceae bacterium]